MSSTAGFRFISSVRRGLVALPGAATSGQFSAAAQLSDGSLTTAVTMQLPSVGDILGLDTTQVTRTYPKAGATDAEPEFFPLVEFGSPHLPWLLPTADSSLGAVPWLCLVVVEERDGVTISSPGPNRLDVLRIVAPARVADELPDPATVPLWAHAFAATTVTAGVGGADPAESAPPAPPAGSRLVAARRLEPEHSYRACLVPTLAAAALAGLQHGDDEIAHALQAAQPNWAWHPGDASAELPVYLSWQFSTGAYGDFETLARLLTELVVPPDFGTHAVDLGLADPGMPATTASTRFRGALVAPDAPAPETWPTADQAGIDERVRSEIAIEAALTADSAASDHGRPALGPLRYAAAAAARSDAGTSSTPADWFEQLNRDPRLRSVAGLGTRVLQRTAEDVMARAWAQVGEVTEANAALRRLQASRAVTASLHARHLSALPPGQLLATARPVLPRARLDAATTGGDQHPDALAAVAASALPAGTTWRGISAMARGQADRLVGSWLGGLDATVPTPDGTVSMALPSTVFGAVAAGQLLTDSVRTAAAAAQLAIDSTATPAAGLDDLVLRSTAVTSKASTTLAAQTGKAVLETALPSKAVFSVGSGGLLRYNELTAAAIEVGVVAHAGATSVPMPAETAKTVLAANLAATTTQHPAVVLSAAALKSAPTTKAPVSKPVDTPVSSPPTTAVPLLVTMTDTDPRLAEMRAAYASVVDRFVRPGTATPLPAAGQLDLVAAHADLLAALDPAQTVVALGHGRIPAVAALSRPDPIAPVMVGPIFTEGAYTALVNASHDALVPGLDSVPDNSITLLETNPEFIAAYLAGLNSALGRELLWRNYPTDERGTYWHSFWGAGQDIGDLHTFRGALADNVRTGSAPLAVLVLRGRLLRRHPDTDIYAVTAAGTPDGSELDDASRIVRPIFRDSVAPDITFVGFPLRPEQLRDATPNAGYWFVLAEHPGQPRFGLTDLPTRPLATWDELAWADLAAAGAAPTYLPATPPSVRPAGSTRNWGDSAADMAAITYQPAVRVAIRATDLLKPAATPPPPGAPTP